MKKTTGKSNFIEKKDELINQLVFYSSKGIIYKSDWVFSPYSSGYNQLNKTTFNKNNKK